MRIDFLSFGRFVKAFHKGFIILVLNIVAYNIQVSASMVEYSVSARDSRAGNIVLADKGFSAYRIVLPSFATIHEQKAAEVLQGYLLQISGAALPIITADKRKAHMRSFSVRMTGWPGSMPVSALTNLKPTAL